MTASAGLTPNNQPTRPFWTPARTAVCLLALALAMRIFNLTYRGLWVDEAKTLDTIRLSPAEIVAERAANGHFPTYFLALSAARSALGESEWALRAPSVLIGALSMLFIFAVANQAWGLRAGAYAGLFYMMNERMLWASQEARPYAFVMFAAAASLFFLIQALRNPRALWWIGYFGCAMLGLLLHPTFAFVYLSQAIVIALWLVARRRMRWDWAIVNGAIFVAGLSCYIALRSFQENSGFYSPPRWPEWEIYREGLLQIFWGEYDLIVGSGFKYLGLPLIAILTAMAYRAARDLTRQNAPGAPPVFALAAAWAPSTLLGMALYSGLGQDIIKGHRYYSVGLGGAALLLALAISSSKNSKLRNSLLGLCLLIQGLVCVGWWFNPGEQIREAIQYVVQNRAENEPVAICHGASIGNLAQYYGLKIEPLSISREAEAGSIEDLLDENLSGGKGFWLILYKEKGSPIRSVASKWTKSRGYGEQKCQFDEADVRRYTKEPTPTK